jgi:peptidoglycan/xylan/chitin deacetylase (PgdA/CDA1 family)
MKKQLIPFHYWSVSAAIFTIALFLSGFNTVIGAILILHAVIFISGIFNIRAAFFCPVLYKRRTSAMQIALTFDDGPDPALTCDILDILNKNKIKATFFVIAKRAAANPEIVMRAMNEGHTIACHDLSHGIFSNFRTTGPLLRQLDRACSIIGQIIGKRPCLYRPPSGLTNPHYHSVLSRLGLTCVGWSKSGGDCGNRRKSGIMKIHSLASSGAVVLLHDALPRPEYKKIILDQLEILCENIMKQKLSPAGIDGMFGVEAYG